MPDVLVRNLEDDVIDRLKTRARVGGRSLQAELKLILEDAARWESMRLSREEYRILAHRVRAALGDRPQTESAALLAEDRSR